MQRGLLVWPAALGISSAAEWAAFSWDEPEHWVPDLLVGLTFVACGWRAWSRGAHGAGALLAATGFAWFLGNFGAAALYLHRGPLVHLVLAYPGWRPRSRLDLAAISGGYCAAVVMPVWRNEAMAILLAVALIAVAGRGYGVAVGRARNDRFTAFQAAAAVGAVLAAGSVARLAFPGGDAADPALLGYEAVLCAVAVGLLARLGGPAATGIADLVVELGEARGGTLRDRLRRALGDPTLELGYWSAEPGSYVDDEGRALAMPAQADDARRRSSSARDRPSPR